MISNFFIRHPIFASALSLVIIFAGLVAMYTLPIEQYPNITPPLIQVQATYNGANADTMANDVASPIEQQILGVQDMIYMYSQNSPTGSMTLDVYFAIGTNADMAQVNVQNQISQAQAQLPTQVQHQGLTITKQSPSILTVIALQSPDGRYDQTFVSNYASINVVNDLDLIPGISNISIIGQRNYAMRIWLRPDLMAQMGISPSDIVAAIQDQNQDFGLGQLGQAPNVHPVTMTVPFSTQGRLTAPEDFEKIVLRADLSGSMVQLKDVATVTLGAQDYTMDGELDGTPSVLLVIYQEYGANALQLTKAIRKAMEKISQRFPEGIVYSIPYDSTLFIHASIKEVIKTMLEAALLVVFIVFLFLQKWRATLIPVMALIVSIIGTFAGMYLLGYSINTLTLFGMVLAIGIVVDDAIVVVENVERNMVEHGLPPKEAALKAMEEVTAPVIAIVFVLCAVFIPVAFLGGIAGELYRQFAITIAISVIFSGIVALSLSPAIAALVLKPQSKPYAWANYFNKGFDWIRRWYVRLTHKLIENMWVGIAIFLAILCAAGFLAKKIPTSFLPDEDQGYLIALTTMPDGASLDRTVAIDQKVEQIAMNHPGVEHVVSLTGFSMVESLPRTTIGTNFIVLKNWKDRKSKDLAAKAILKELNRSYANLLDASVTVLNPPVIQGLGTVGGFEFWIENRGDGGPSALSHAIESVIKAAHNHPELQPLHTTAQFDNLQFYINLDRAKAKMLGVSVTEVFQALQTLVGSVYVNNFNKFGRVYQVIVQADPAYRESLSDLGNVYVRSELGEMVPLQSLITIEYGKGANLVSRFNDFPAAEILGSPAPGYTSGQAIEAMIKVAQETLSEDFTYGWSGAAYQEIEVGGTSLPILAAAMILVFLVLAALYEKWSAPLAILLAVPFGVFGALVAIYLKHMPNDVYFQIGLVTLIALAAKNAILIVEFAIQKHKEGLSLTDAALEAAKLRFRAIIMTSLTFIFGVLPLVTSQGAGAASRHSVGVGVMGGMIAATSLAIFFVPLFFKLFYKEKK